MAESLKHTPDDAIITGWDFSTGAVKCVAFELDGRVVAEARLPTDLWRGEERAGKLVDAGIHELNLMQLEGQARASVREMADRLRGLGRLDDWRAGGVSATHHTAGRIDKNRIQVRRAICWNDQTLARHHEEGLQRLGGQEKALKLIGGPWAIRYSLTHLVKDEKELPAEDWRRTWLVLPHGPLAIGYLTGVFDKISVSAAASTGIMDLRSRKWSKGMLAALGESRYRNLAWKQLPEIVDDGSPIGPLAPHVALEAGLGKQPPLVFPNLDDQLAGLVGGGAVSSGQMAVVLGNSVVVNSSAGELPKTTDLDIMALNWPGYLVMRCYTNGAGFFDQVIGAEPSWTSRDWSEQEKAAAAIEPDPDRAMVLPFPMQEPSLGIFEKQRGVRWFPTEPDPKRAPGLRYRAAAEALAYLIKLGIEAHEAAGQRIERISVSGGLAQSDLVCKILATVLERPLERLASKEGPALGAAAAALAGYERSLRRKNRDKTDFTVADAVAQIVRFRRPVKPHDPWREIYRRGFEKFQERLEQTRE
ncbi:MAG: xylulose kinase [Planctomycetes bacterium]|nr:xylulose kinase [Planctomycetota bacterium]